MGLFDIFRRGSSIADAVSESICEDEVVTKDFAQQQVLLKRAPVEKNKIKGFVEVTVIRADGTIEKQQVTNALTTTGKNYFADLVYTNTAAASTYGCNYIGLGTGTQTVDGTQSSLTSEVTTSGLARAIATTLTTSTNGNTTTLSKQFTAGAAQNTNITRVGLFNASSSGVMAHIASVTGFQLAQNDSVIITWTLTIS